MSRARSLIALFAVATVLATASSGPVQGQEDGDSSVDFRSASSSGLGCGNWPCTLSIPRPEGVETGDVLIAVIAHEASLMSTPGWLPLKDDPTPPMCESEQAGRIQSMFWRRVGDLAQEPSQYDWIQAREREHGLYGIISAYSGVLSVPLTAGAGGGATYASSKHGSATAPSVPAIADSRLVYAASLWGLSDGYSITSPDTMMERARREEVNGSFAMVLADEGWPVTEESGPRSATVDADGCYVAQMIALTPEDVQVDTSVDDAVLEDAQTHAENLGVTVAEALFYLQAQEEIGEFEALAESSEPEIYAGTEIAYHPYRVIVYSTDVGTSAFHELATKNGFEITASLLVVQPAQFNLLDLEAGADAFLDSAPDVPFAQALDISSNRVELHTDTVANGDQLRYAINNTTQSLPVEAFSVMDDVELPSELGYSGSIWGGNKLSYTSDSRYCTAGFTVRRKSSGLTAVTTAEHCADSLKIGGQTLTYKDGALGGSYDVQWHHTPNLKDRPKVNDGSRDGWRTVKGQRHRSNQGKGHLVCHYGQSTGYSCGKITIKAYRPPPSSRIPHPSRTWIVVEGSNLRLLGGDSGGPFYSGDIAYGILSGGKSRFGYYMPINFIDPFGLEVLRG